MQPRHTTTPFGRRSLTLAHVATQALANARPADKVVHKWILFRAICTAKARLDVSDRALAVLNALLTFHPDTTLGGDALIVFPSNAQLSLRSHGMAPATLRRHLAVLVDAGLICRRDSPNGKRYARRGNGGEIETAYGFDLGPLVARADEIDKIADEITAEERALKIVRERITLCRRDIAKMIEAAIEEDAPCRAAGRGFASWTEAHVRFRELVGRIPRTASRGVLEPLADELAALAEDILILLEAKAKTKDSSANESQTERHKQNSKTNTPIDLEPGFSESQAAKPEQRIRTAGKREGSFPLGLVLDACPDIIDYARSGISCWRDLMATARVVRSVLGISPSAWDDACEALGEYDAVTALAAILQRGEAISSAGGYLRELTRKAVAGEFSVGPMIMALLSVRRRALSA
ncbi:MULTISPECIES: plasmid replication protein RepC [Hansschlegelia]|uniref:Replication initiation protein RepC n=1 Tax=Hansschlegelia zhihuaiae TaxID=405005 RepID=A0A4Q0MDQ0_9HYPH|nr:plasmid replication protein RepC [Hansschlegelia zhihuaiae]RXF71520.1 replication initiation protein RepC [Hansschlegelia zhihuaiae]